MPDLDIHHIRLLVKGGWLKSERVNDIVDGLRAIVEGFPLLLSGWVGTWTVVKIEDFPAGRIKDGPILMSPPSLIVTMAQSTSYTMSSTFFLPNN
jgi:hypothetical protein